MEAKRTLATRFICRKISLQAAMLKYKLIRCFKSPKLQTSLRESLRCENEESGTSAAVAAFSLADHVFLWRLGVRQVESMPTTDVTGAPSRLPLVAGAEASAAEKWQPQELGFWRRKLSQTERDLARDLRERSLLIWALRED